LPDLKQHDLFFWDSKKDAAYILLHPDTLSLLGQYELPDASYTELEYAGYTVPM